MIKTLINLLNPVFKAPAEVTAADVANTLITDGIVDESVAMLSDMIFDEVVYAMDKIEEDRLPSDQGPLCDEVQQIVADQVAKRIAAIVA